MVCLVQDMVAKKHAQQSFPYCRPGTPTCTLGLLPYNVNNFLSPLLGENFFKNKWENSDGGWIDGNS
jgi:hypothetical protein